MTNAKIEIAGVNMFTSKKVAKKFIDMQIAITLDKGKKGGDMFRDIVTGLFWRKQESEEGEFKEYKITHGDLNKSVANLEI